MNLVNSKKVVNKIQLSDLGVRAIILAALKDDPTYVLDQLGIHECDSDMFIFALKVFVCEGVFTLEIEEVNN